MGKLIYLDNAATTKTAPEVVEAMLPYFTEHFGNPSSVYSVGSSNKEVITKQRETIAKALGAKTDEIYFTAGGSESDNWALKATAEEILPALAEPEAFEVPDTISKLSKELYPDVVLQSH